RHPSLCAHGSVAWFPLSLFSSAPLYHVYAVLENPRVPVTDMGCVLDICRGISDQFAVDAGQYDLVVCHLGGDTVGDVGIPGLLLAQEIGNLKPLSLQLELDREVAVDDLHAVFESFRDAPAHVLCVRFKRPDHRIDLLAVGFSGNGNLLAITGHADLREPDAPDQLALGTGH